MTRHKTVYSKIRHRDQSLSISEANHLGNVQIYTNISYESNGNMMVQVLV